MQINKKIGEKIRKIRLEKKLKQSELAEKAKISRVAIGNYERGDRLPNAKILKAIADALNVNVSALANYQTFSHELAIQIYKVIEEQWQDDLDVEEGDILDYIEEEANVKMENFIEAYIKDDVDLTIDEQKKLVSFFYRLNELSFRDFYVDVFIVKDLMVDEKIKSYIDNLLKLYNNSFSTSKSTKLWHNYEDISSQCDPSTYSNEDIAHEHLKALVYYVNGGEDFPSEVYNIIFKEVCNTIKYTLFKIKNS